MKHAFLLITLLVCVCLRVHSQTPCVDGMAGIYPCCNYDLQSITPLDEIGVSNKSSDIWGWTDSETGNEYALYCGNNGTSFINITDPLAPIFVGFLNAQTSESNWRDVKVHADHAFIVSEASGYGMQVFDLSRLTTAENLPVDFDVDAHLDFFGSAHNIAINEASGYAYVIGAEPFDGGPIFIDLSDPINPTVVGGYDGDGYTHDTQVVIYSGPDVEHQWKEIAFAFNENSLTIIDVTDKTDPIQLSRLEYVQSDYSHQGWLNETQDVLFLGDETDELEYGFNSRTMIMDVNDLDEPFLIEEHFGVTAATDHNMYVNGNLLFQSNNGSGLRVLEISDSPSDILEEVGFFDAFPENDDAGFTGTWSVYPYFESGNIILSARFGGLFIVTASEEESCAVGVDKLENVEFEIFPNPTKSKLNISIKENFNPTGFVVNDIVGKLVLQTIGNINLSNVQELDVSSLNPGLYFIRAVNNSRSIRFIVE